MARNYGAPFTKPDGEDHSDESHAGTKGHHDPTGDPDALAAASEKKEEGEDTLASDRAQYGWKSQEVGPASENFTNLPDAMSNDWVGDPIGTDYMPQYESHSIGQEAFDAAEQKVRDAELEERRSKGSGKPGPNEY